MPGIALWGDIELAWRVRDKVVRADGTPADWVLITGTNGKTTTTRLTATMLVEGGLRAAPVGNIGTPVLDAVRDPAGLRRARRRALEPPALVPRAAVAGPIRSRRTRACA